MKWRTYLCESRPTDECRRAGLAEKPSEDLDKTSTMRISSAKTQETDLEVMMTRGHSENADKKASRKQEGANTAGRKRDNKRDKQDTKDGMRWTE